MKHPAYLYLFVSLLSVLFTGCIKDDLSDCPTELKVYITYEPVTYARTGVDPLEVKKIDLFLFDADGIFQGVWVDQSPMIGDDYFITLPNQPEGKYRFVAWGCISGKYSTNQSDFVIGETTFDEAFLELARPSDQVSGGVQPLFYADKSERLLGVGREEVHMTIRQDYNTINLTTEGLLDNGSAYRLAIYDNNGKYKFDSSFAECNEFAYFTTCERDAAAQLQASVNVLRLASDREVIFEVADVITGTILFRADLIKLINAAQEVNFDLVHVFDVHLKFGLNISVSINGWEVVDNGEFILK